ncbi:MAG: VOC family protein [Bryobacteraceae bacterium]|jgi:predicted enzyme related to lactoylglutathione lyase
MIKRIKFLGIPVRDQDRALKFYTEILGFRLLTDQQFSESQRWIELSIPGADTGISLFTPEGHEDRVGTFVNTSWEVDNVDKTYAELQGKGVEFAGPPQKQPWGTFAVMKDSEGNQIVLSARS